MGRRGRVSLSLCIGGEVERSGKVKPLPRFMTKAEGDFPSDPCHMESGKTKIIFRRGPFG